MIDIAKKRSRKREFIVGGVALALTIGICIAVIYYWDYVVRVQQYGYLGAFLISIFAGGTIVVPVPGLLVVFTLGSVLNPAIVGVISGLGEAIGSIAIYLTGYGGHAALQNANRKLVARFRGWLDNRGWLTVFAMSAIFNPLFYPFTAMAGMVHFGLAKFFFLCWAGKTVKNTAVAYLGYFGLGSLLHWVGIGI